MKIVKVLVLVVTILISTISNAQNKGLDGFFERHDNNAEVSVGVPMFAVKLLISYVELDNKVKAIINDVKNAKVHVYSEKNVAKDFKSMVSKTNLQKLLHVKEKGDNIGIYIDQLENMIKGMLITVEDKDGSFVLVDLKTEMSVEDLQERIKEFDE